MDDEELSLIGKIQLGVSVRAPKHRKNPVTELMMGLPKRMHVSGQESPFGLDVFG